MIEYQFMLEKSGTGLLIISNGNLLTLVKYYFRICTVIIVTRGCMLPEDVTIKTWNFDISHPCV